ncbi:HNH endonuclease [Planococcus sp. X10-3]|uniref:HNH endonuclease n=1 Tax=Planococcus sp. X10-3 TaxID=3061240 RepID=UPI003BB17B1C
MIEAFVAVMDTQPEGLIGNKESQDFVNVPSSLHEVINSPSDITEKKAANVISCINERFEGSEHDKTSIEYIRKEVEMSDGEIKEGVFPVFDSAFDAHLDKPQYEQSDAKHFKEANSQLKEAIENNPEMGDKFTAEQLEQIEFNDTPDGYTWHHSEDAGQLQLVDSMVHAQSGHTGGRSIWGGGSENR